MSRAQKAILIPVTIAVVVGSLVFAINVQKSSAAYTCLNGGDHGGANWDPATDCPSGLFAGVHTNIGTFSIATGETATVQAYNGTSYGTADVTATTISIVGTLTASSKGYPGGTGTGGNGSGPGGGAGSASVAAGGGGYGGYGATGNNGASGGLPYGSAANPAGNMGSGGGDNNGAGGGAGGGAIKLTASGTATISGTIASNGGNGGGNSAGAGSGGGIYITAGTITGAGSITANGGLGSNGGWGGAGAGGRVKVGYSTANTFTGTMTANAGASGGSGQQSGTVVVYDSTNNDLYINSSQNWFANPAIDGSSFTYHNVTVQNNSTWGIYGYYTTNTNGVGMTFNVNNFTVSTGSTVSASGTGYAGGTSNGNGAGPGGGVGSSSLAPGGGGYGSYGSTGNNGASGGAPYGSAMSPTALGSGGGANGATFGGAGGGAIIVSASGTVTVSGAITANGSNGNGSHAGGGSGGTVSITAPTIAGAGSITANGGNGCCSGWGGGGGGGRIKLSYSSSNTYSGTMTASIGSSGAGAGNGSVVVYDSTNNDLTINATQTWYANPAVDGSSFTFRNVTIQNNSTLGIAGYSTTNTNGIGITFKVVNFTISTGSSLSASGGGYAGGGSGSNGSGPGGGIGSTSVAPGGGGYGGNGGTGNAGAAGGTTYGLKLEPADLGSGGGGGNGTVGGAGGGAVMIKSVGTVTVSGSITANGVNASGTHSGGGSGGSIFVIANTFAGAGSVTANGGNGCCSGWGGGGGGGRISINYGSAYTFSGTLQASAGSSGAGMQSGTIIAVHHALIDRAITMSSSVPGGTAVSYEVTFKPTTTTAIGGIVVDICDDTPIYGAATCAYPAGFDWGGASPTLTVNGGMGTGWTASGVQGGAGSGKSQVLELSNATPQSVSTSTNIDFTVTTATNPSTANHTFYARVLTFNTSGNMTSEYTVSGTTRSGNLNDSLDNGGFALSTGQGIAISFAVPESLSFCVSATSIGSNCSGVTSPNITIGHGSPTLLDSSTVDKSTVYTQTATNAQYGVTVRLVKGSRAIYDPVGAQYRLPITINNTSNASTLTNYQVKITVNTATLVGAGKMRSDCGDARFVDADQITIMNYWLASGCNSSSTSFWVKIPSIPGSASKTVYMYYGNTSLTSASNGANTFIYYDDFSTNTTVNYVAQGGATIAYDATNKLMQQTNTGSAQHWIVGSTDSLPNAYVYEADVRVDTDPAARKHAGLATDFLTSAVTGYRLTHLDGNFDVTKWSNGSSTAIGSFADGGIYTQGSFLTERVYRNRSSGLLKYEITNGTTTVSQSYTDSTYTTGHIGFHSYGDSTSMDNIHVRAYSSPEPTASLGSESTTGCGGLSADNGRTCQIPAVNTSCSGSCSATTISAGTAAFGLCVAAGTGSITVAAPYDGVNCGSTGTTYGLDDATATSVRSPYGSPVFSSSGMLTAENDTLTFAATASALTPGGIYTGSYMLIATGSF